MQRFLAPIMHRRFSVTSRKTLVSGTAEYAQPAKSSQVSKSRHGAPRLMQNKTSVGFGNREGCAKDTIQGTIK